MAAADSALGGQFAARTVRVWKAAWAVQREEADTLRQEVQLWQKAGEAEAIATRREREAGMILQEALRKESARLNRARTWIWVGTGAGLLLGVLVAK